MSTEPKKTKNAGSEKSRSRSVARFLFVDLWRFISSTGPMMIGIILGSVVGGAGAIYLGLSIISGLLFGAVIGLVLALLLQVLILGSGGL